MRQELDTVELEGFLGAPDRADLNLLEQGYPVAEELTFEEPAILAELVIEEVSIDGMCGVY